MDTEKRVYLHCMVCSIGGTRPSDSSRVALVKYEEIRLPIDASHFGPLYPERMTDPPWQSGCSWDRMICPRCRRPIWGMTEKEALDAMEGGGPDRILITTARMGKDGQMHEKTRVAMITEDGMPPYAKKKAK